MGARPRLRVRWAHMIGGREPSSAQGRRRTVWVGVRVQEVLGDREGEARADSPPIDFPTPATTHGGAAAANVSQRGEANPLPQPQPLVTACNGLKLRVTVRSGRLSSTFAAHRRPRVAPGIRALCGRGLPPALTRGSCCGCHPVNQSSGPSGPSSSPSSMWGGSCAE